MINEGHTSRPMRIALLAVVALAVLTGGVAGIASAEVSNAEVSSVEVSSADRTVENSTLAPGETTQVTVTIDNNGEDKPALFEQVGDGLEIVDRNEEDADFTAVNSDGTEVTAIWDGVSGQDTLTFTYTVKVSEDAEEGSVLGLAGDVDTESGSVTVGGDETIFVSESGEPADVTLGLDVDQHPMTGEEVTITVSVLNPTDSAVERDLQVMQNGEVVGQESGLSVGANADTTRQFTVQVSDQRTAEVHAAMYGNQVTAAPVYVDIPDRQPGDVQGDGEVNAFDAIEIQRKIVGIETDPGFDQRVADVDRSGGLDAFDVIGIQRIIVGLGIEDQTIDADAVDPSVDQSFDVPVQNPSSVGALDGFALELENQDTGETVVVDAATIDIQPDGQVTATMNIDAQTYGLDSGTYTVRTVGLVDQELGTVTVE